MGVAFLTPLFLLGLLAVIVPILIHLYRREKSRVVAFPSLMFLQRIPYRSVRQQRVRHWLLLLMRAAALALLALAFARPLLRSGVVASPAIESRRDVVVLVDRSFSMSYGDRWDRATTAARQVLASLGPEDRGVIVVFDERAVALTELTSDHETLTRAIDGLAPSDGATALGPALRLARRLLAESDLPRREVVLISDHQRSGWSPGDSVRLPQGTALVQVDLSDATAANLAVASVLLDRSHTRERQRVEVSARVTNRGERKFSSVPVRLELDGRSVQSKEVSLDADGSVTVAFDPLSVGRDDFVRGVVRIDGDALTADNAFHFVLSPAHGISAVVLEGRGRERSASLYLERALELGQRPFFRLDRRAANGLQERDLRRHDVVIVNDDADVPAVGSEALMSFVERGGGLWLVLGRSSATGEPSPLARRLGLGAPRVVDRTGDWGGSLAFVDYTHPMLELFSSPRSGDFGSARFFRYHDLSPLEATPVEGSVHPTEPKIPRVVARFDDGKPALIERAHGDGRILIWASTLDTLWNNLALQPVFLPFVHQVTTYLATYEPPRDWYTVGQVAELAGGRRIPREGEWLVLTPSGGQRTADLTSGVLLTLEERGFYEARPVGASFDDGEAVETDALSIAVNVDAAESDLRALDPEELAAAIRPFEEEAPSGSESSGTVEEREQRQRIWWYLLIVALALLAVETAVSNRLSLGRAGAAER